LKYVSLPTELAFHHRRTEMPIRINDIQNANRQHPEILGCCLFRYMQEVLMICIFMSCENIQINFRGRSKAGNYINTVLRKTSYARRRLQE